MKCIDTDTFYGKVSVSVHRYFSKVSTKGLISYMKLVLEIVI